MKYQEIKNMNEEKLRQLMNEKRNEVVDMKSDLRVKEVKDYHKIGQNRKDVARILTELNVRELGKGDKDAS